MIRTVISDMGNVLVHFDHWRSCRALAEMCDLSPERIYEKMFRSGLELEYDLGRISSEAFGHKIMELLDLSCPLDVIRRIWSEIFWPMDGMEDLVRALKKNYKLVLLSNTNEWHFSYCYETYPLIKCFDAYALSFRVGSRKPDPAIFESALRMAGPLPEECVYIDDVQDYVTAGQELGIQGIRFEDVPGLKAKLDALGIVLE